MPPIRLILASLLLSLSPAAAQDHPEGLHVHDAYARLGPASGAVFFLIHNNTTTDDRLIGIRTDLAQRAELHSHSESTDGVMTMGRIDIGVPLPAGAMYAFERGGDHVMLMGLGAGLKDGDVIPLTLIFASGAEMALEVPVDNARLPGAAMDHSGHSQTNAPAAD